MTATLSRPAGRSSFDARIASRSIQAPVPVLAREAIEWTGGPGSLHGGPLRLSLAFENPADVPTPGTAARVEVAGFGAFVPWSPLLRVSVPAIPPGGRRVVTATAAGDAWEPEPLRLPSAVRRRLRAASPMVFWRPRVLTHLVGRPQSVHFVGNLNVFVTHGQPVERHVQRAIGLQRGAMNLALFMVGGVPNADERYAFEPEVDASGWQVEVAGVRWGRLVPAGIYTLVVVPPPRGQEGARIAIHVRHASTGETVPVEFELEARPSGAKCYAF